MTRKFCITVVFLLACIHSKAQFGKLFTPDDLLSSSLVNDITQDRNGFVWIATQDGLNCYDSHRMAIFHKDDRSQLISNVVNCVTVSQLGRLFVGTAEGVQVFDFSTGRFLNIPMEGNGKDGMEVYVTCIANKKNGDVLVSTSGKGVYVIKKGAMVGKRMNVKCGDHFRYVMEDSHGRIWLVTDNDGIFGITGNQLSQYFHDTPHRSSLYGCCEDKQGNIYAATQTDGLYIYNNVTSTFQQVPVTAGVQVSRVLVSRTGQIFLGSDGAGLKIYDPIAGTLIPARYYSNQMDMNRAKIHGIMEDSEGNIWLAAFQKGVFFQARTRGAFGYIGPRSFSRNSIGNCCVMSVIKTSDGIIWVGTDQDGLYGVDAQGQLKKRFPAGHNGLPATILSMSEDENHHIWVGSYLEGAGVLDTRTGSYKRLPFTTGAAKNVFGICADKKGKVWIATMGAGVFCYDIASGEKKNYRWDKNNPNSLPTDYLSAVSLSDDGKKLFIPTCDGLACLDLEKNSLVSEFGKSKILSGLVYNVRQTPDGALWVGAADGLYRIRKHGTDIKHYTVAQGLPNNMIRAIEVDKKGNLWISSNRGISYMDVKRETFSNYSTGDGLQGNEFSDNASFVDGDEYIFGGNNGITLFHPNQIRHQHRKLKVHLVAMTTDEQNVVKGMKSGVYEIVDTAVIDATRFDLASSNNSFNLRFSSMEYANPEQVIYMYSINNAEWVSLSPGTSETNFSNLPAGKYRFRIRARHNDVYSDIREFTIVVHPAWYASTWAMLAYLLIAIAGVIYIIRSRRRKEKAKLRLQEHIHAEQLNEAKIQFFMNISHDIRTPMTLIMSPLHKLMSTDNDEQRQKQYALMDRNGKRIISLINQLMDLRKIDKGMMPMDFKTTDVVSVVNDIYSLFTYQSSERSIDYQFIHDKDRLLADIDRTAFDKIMMNVLGNAFKYVPDQGKIRIVMEEQKDTFTIKIVNSGSQISPDKIERIFDRFYQINNSGSAFTGTGIGLHLTRSLVVLHSGTITAHNEEDGSGCYFLITLPLKQQDTINIEQTVEPDPPKTVEDIHEVQDTENPITPRGSKRKQVLVVEDDDEIRQYIVQEFSQYYQTVECTNGKAALDYTLKNTPDLIITDVMMPVMDGVTLCQKIKRNVNTNHVPVIMLTAKNSDEDRLTGLGAGADSYIVKPFNIEILMKAAENLIQSRQILRNKFTGKESQAAKVEQLELKTPDDRLLERIMSTINKNMSNPDLSVEFISQEVGISRAHLHRKLKELTNQSPRDFIRNIRLKQAANLLASGNQNVTEVMYAVGFQNAASFSTMFKNFYGISPKDYTKEHSKK